MEDISATTTELWVFNQHALHQQYNRAVRDDLWQAIDPNGRHILSNTLEHQHKAGQPCETHNRTIWLVQMLNKIPRSISIDVPKRVFIDFMNRKKDLPMSYRKDSAVPDQLAKTIAPTGLYGQCQSSQSQLSFIKNK